MGVLSRQFFSFAVIDAPLETIIQEFRERGPKSVTPSPTAFVFPLQSCHATEADLPMLLWSPSCAPSLTAFMQQAQSGDYFVVEYAHNRFHHSVASVRSTTQEAEWPINEFIAYQKNKEKRIVRAMRDSPRWEFFTSGEPLPYENVKLYGKRKIRERFTRSDLVSYIEAWGAPINDPNFWTTNSSAFTFRRI